MFDISMIPALAVYFTGFVTGVLALALGQYCVKLFYKLQFNRKVRALRTLQPTLDRSTAITMIQIHYNH